MGKKQLWKPNTPTHVTIIMMPGKIITIVRTIIWELILISTVKSYLYGSTYCNSDGRKVSNSNSSKGQPNARGSHHCVVWVELDVRNLIPKRKGCVHSLNPWPPGCDGKTLHKGSPSPWVCLDWEMHNYWFISCIPAVIVWKGANFIEGNFTVCLEIHEFS